MKFDTTAPGGGLEIQSVIENGKASFQCTFHFQCAQPEKGSYVELRIWDRENRLVFRACWPGEHQEPLKGMILHPHLWKGVEDVYLYRVQAVLLSEQGCEEDLLERSLAFYHLDEIPMKGWFLNKNSIEVRAVEYKPSTFEENQLRKDLQLIRNMGANGISATGEENNVFLSRICEEMGLILWKTSQDDIPEFHQFIHKGSLTDCYYYYKACWSKEPFVYISKESLSLESDGTVRVTVYSNQPKVALYTEGDLFEFRREGPDFIFEGIPVKQLPILLTAETGACSMSLSDYSVHKMFTI